MKKKLILSIFVVTIASSCLIYKRHHADSNTATEAVWVQATKVQESILPKEAHAIGTLVARSVEITPELSGHIEKVYFQDGASVKQGDVLVQLDDALYKAKNASALARLKYSENNYQRSLLLGKKGMISKQAIDQADADFKERKADADETSVMLQKTKLVAPFDGMVGKSNINMGDYVNVGQKLVMLTDIKHLRIEYNLPEKYLALVKSGQDVNITTATYPGKIFTGKLSFISPTINTDSRTISVYADITNDDKSLAAGMFVNVAHSLGSDEKVLMVPERSLIPILDGQQVYRVVEGKAYAVTAIVGKRLNGNIQVEQGLSAGDLVVTDGQMKLKNGMSVKVKT
jgi:membrane fusion protein (multidrug efflux system)